MGAFLFVLVSRGWSKKVYFFHLGVGKLSSWLLVLEELY